MMMLTCAGHHLCWQGITLPAASGSSGDPNHASQAVLLTSALPHLPCSASPVHVMCVSPDSCKNPVLYWLGGYTNARFDLETAAGPFKMDLGDSMYAPNIMTDGQGRHLLWGWMQVGAAGCTCHAMELVMMTCCFLPLKPDKPGIILHVGLHCRGSTSYRAHPRCPTAAPSLDATTPSSDAPDTPTTTATPQEQAERRPAGKYDYSGCLTTPRVLTLEEGRLHQAPAPEVAALRGEGTREFNLKLPQEQAVPLLQVGSVTVTAVLATGAAVILALLCCWV
jgi:hypothetical protein